MYKEIFFQELAIVKEAHKKIAQSQPITKENYSALLIEYEKLLHQAMHITRISDKLSTTLNSYKHELLEQVNVDELTSLYNRRYLFTLLEKYFKECTRSQSHISAIMVDIDCFKNYNDYYGHLSGDFCLREVAVAIRKAVSRSSDFVARYGGEEFYVIMPSTHLKGALHIADKIAKNIADLAIPHIHNNAGEFITVSMGVSCVIPTLDTSMADLLNAADKALYQSKMAGRNCIKVGEVTIPDIAIDE